MIDYDDYPSEKKPFIEKYLQCIRLYNLKELAPIISQIPPDIIKDELYVIAAENGKPEDEAILKYLLNTNKDSGEALQIIRNENYRTLRMAVEHGHTKITELLLTFIPKEEQSCTMIDNPMVRNSFLQAVRAGYLTIVEQLLKGGNQSFPDELLNHLFEYAIRYKSPAIFNFLLTQYSDVYEWKALDFLNDAIENNNFNAFFPLRDRYRNVFQKNILCLISTAAKNQSSLLEELLREFVTSAPRVDKFSPDFAILRTNMSISTNLFKLNYLIFNIFQISRNHEAVKKLMCVILEKSQQENMEIEGTHVLETEIIKIFPNHSPEQYKDIRQYSKEIYDLISYFYRQYRLSKEQMIYNCWFKKVPDMCWADPDRIKDVMPYALATDWQKYFKFIFSKENFDEPRKAYLEAMRSIEKGEKEKLKALENLLFSAPRSIQYYYLTLFIAACDCKKGFEYLCNQIPEEEKANLIQWVMKELLNYYPGSRNFSEQKQLVLKFFQPGWDLNEQILNYVAALMKEYGMLQGAQRFEERLTSRQVIHHSVEDLRAIENVTQQMKKCRRLNEARPGDKKTLMSIFKQEENDVIDDTYENSKGPRL